MVKLSQAIDILSSMLEEHGDIDIKVWPYSGQVYEADANNINICIDSKSGISFVMIED